MNSTGIRKDCFGYVAGKKDCQVLTENICVKREECPFFKTREDFQRGLKGLPPIGEKVHATRRGKAVRCLETGEEFISARAAAEAFSLLPAAVASLCRGEKTYSCAFHFVYVEEEKA